MIHFAIKKTLQEFNITPIFFNKETKNIDNVCINTFCENDLILNGKKIVGSCLRRRGNKLIVQGSIHINLSNYDKRNFSENFAKNISKFLKIKIQVLCFNEHDIMLAKKIAYEKYSNYKWNNKF
jgi:lipoate-protein ligase A